MLRFGWGTTVLLLALSLSVTRVNAAPLNYDEGVSGDLPSAPTSLTLPLDVGTNTIKGSGSLDVITNPFSVHSDSDSFSLTIPAGDVLTSITYTTVKTGFFESLTSLLDGFQLDSGPKVDIDVRNEIGTLSLFAGQLPLGPGTHTMDNDGIAFGIHGSPSETGMDWDFTWTFEVTRAVPLPGTLLLLGSGLVGLGGLGWRRRRPKRNASNPR